MVNNTPLSSSVLHEIGFEYSDIEDGEIYSDAEFEQQLQNKLESIPRPSVTDATQSAIVKIDNNRPHRSTKNGGVNSKDRRRYNYEHRRKRQNDKFVRHRTGTFHETSERHQFGHRNWQRHKALPFHEKNASYKKIHSPGNRSRNKNYFMK